MYHEGFALSFSSFDYKFDFKGTDVIAIFPLDSLMSLILLEEHVEEEAGVNDLWKGFDVEDWLNVFAWQFILNLHSQ